MTPAAAELDEGLALGLEQLAAQPLVVLRAALDRAVVAVVEACPEAVVRNRYAPRTRSAVSSRTHSSSTSSSSRARAASAAWIRAFASSRSSTSVVLETEQADDEREGQALTDERDEDDREREEEDRGRAPGTARPRRSASGSASAAARETAPRIPDQERNTAPRQFDIRRAIHLGACSTAKTQAKRRTMTVRLTSAA